MAVKKYGLDVAFELIRSGAKGDMKTSYGVLFDHKLEPSELAAIKAAPQIDIPGALGLTAEPASTPAAPAAVDDSDIPF